MAIANVAGEGLRLATMALLFLIACIVMAIGALVRPILVLADIPRR